MGSALQFANVISPFEESMAYEAIWHTIGTKFSEISKLLKNSDALPSELIKTFNIDNKDDLYNNIYHKLNKSKPYKINVKGAFQYPESVQDAKNAFVLLYYKGNIDYLSLNKRISIVGARKASEEGLKRAKKLARLLVENGCTIVSGLAAGIDTAAMSAAIDAKGKTIGVAGMPIHRIYPKENESLYNSVAENHLLMSHVPIYLYDYLHIKQQRLFFPQRNELMSAISEATIIVEASDTSGSLTQARECLRQGRKLFILESCFNNPNIKWPDKFLSQGAIKVTDIKDIVNAL